MLKFITAKLDLLRERVAARPIQQGPARIFLYWDKGFENAPPLVQACHRQVVRVHAPSDFVALTAATWRDHVALPPHVTQKLAPNKAHFADILRMALLAQYGGTWMDATCYPSRNILDFQREVSGSGWFCYRHTGRISNWFLCSAGDNYVARMMYEGLVEFWRDFDKPTHYFFFHHMFEALALLDARFQEQFQASPVIRSRPSLRIQRALFEPFDAKAFEQMLSAAAVHKLTYKIGDKTAAPGDLITHLLETPGH
jgi:hypothetical protein